LIDFHQNHILKIRNFTVNFFTNEEISYCIKFKVPYTHFAGKFALKEAVIKAIDKKISLLDIETFHKNNIPQVKLKNEINYSSISSISHENNVTVAVFLLEFYA
jgi:holo-[acyl-carrier protein] synthase